MFSDIITFIPLGRRFMDDTPQLLPAVYLNTYQGLARETRQRTRPRRARRAVVKEVSQMINGVQGPAAKSRLLSFSRFSIEAKATEIKDFLNVIRAYSIVY